MNENFLNFMGARPPPITPKMAFLLCPYNFVQCLAWQKFYPVSLSFDTQGKSHLTYPEDGQGLSCIMTLKMIHIY